MYMYLCVWGNEMNRIEYIWKKGKRTKDMIYGVVGYIFIIIYFIPSSTFLLPNLPAHKSIQLKIILSMRTKIKETFFVQKTLD